ncbi:MAG: hypothetical protein ACD_66C00270G0003 [uncultured bacterium]|nr:MAG: hypothetical protein ACD_66C00270G0003 [uncultured bacterium]
MVERIEKKEFFEYWQVEASTETHKDRKEDEESQGDGYKTPYETTDWKLFFDKSQLWNKNIQILKEEIAQIVFQKINLKSDPSLLRVDIFLNSGSKISPAFVSLSRAESLMLKNMLPGHLMSLDTIVKNKSLIVMVPTNPEKFIEEEKKLQLKRSNKGHVLSQELSEETTTVIKQTVKNSVFILRDQKTGKIKMDVFTLYVVTLVLFFMLLTGIIWLVRL